MSSEITGKTLTFVEMDLDLYRVTQFEAALANEAVANWTELWNTTDASFAGVINSNLPSGRGLRLLKSSVTGQPTFLRWTLVPSIQDVSCVALIRFPGAGSTISGIITRGSSSANTGYACILYNLTDIKILKYVAGSPTTLATVSFDFSLNENLWMRFDALNTDTGVLLRAKVWRGELINEPSVFTISNENTSSPLTSANYVGMLIPEYAVDNYCGHFRARSLFGSSTETYKYAKPTSYLPLDATVPNIKDISYTPVTLSLGENLGSRAQVQVKFKDTRGADQGELYEKGTYWGKFRARGIFRRGQPFRLIEELLDSASSTTNHFQLDSFTGPNSSDEFSITAQDIIKFADNDRAQAPALSNGLLVSAITNVATTATLSPSGIGNLEYPLTGIVAIGGEEVCNFTRSGDTLTLQRGQFNTTAIAHNAQDRVQLCLYYSGKTPAYIINDLLMNYANIDSIYLPSADWEIEVATYLQRLYGRLITEPTGVNKLVSELIQQAGLIVWWDSSTQRVELRVLRGIPTNAFTYDTSNTLIKSAEVEEQPSKRLTEVWTYYGVRNRLKPLDQLTNYRSAKALTDLEAATLNGSATILKIFGTWIPDLAASTADRVNTLQLGRFVVPPRKVKFSLMRYSGIQEPVLAGGYRFKYHGAQDEAGGYVDIPIQVTSISHHPDKLEVTAEEMLFKQFNAADLQDRVITVDANYNNLNLKTVHDSQYPALTAQDVTDGVTLTCTINAGVIVGSAATSSPAFDVGTGWPTGLDLTIRVNGRIQGRGGNGSSFGADGFPGGTAFYSRFAVTVENNNQIWGGGGGGGSSGAFNNYSGGGGGGAGQNPGLGGAGAPNSNAGANGTTEAGGLGGEANLSGTTGDGGPGGGPGLPGGSGTPIPPFVPTAGVGGAAGNAIDGVSYCTFTANGDRRGPEVN